MQMKPLFLSLLVAVLFGCSTNPTHVEKVLELKEGMTTNEVLVVMGPPNKVQEFPAQRLTQWEWSSRSIGVKRNGSILISDGVVFQVPTRNAHSRAEARADRVIQMDALKNKVADRDASQGRKRPAGFVSVEEQNESARAIDEELRRIAARREAEALAARRAYVDARPAMPASHREAILARSILAGMTRDDVLTAWGKPESKNVTQGKGWRSEQWAYPGNRYLYFRNGILDTLSFPE